MAWRLGDAARSGISCCLAMMTCLKQCLTWRVVRIQRVLYAANMRRICKGGSSAASVEENARMYMAAAWKMRRLLSGVTLA